MVLLKERLKGIFCPMVTPTDGNDRVDEVPLRSLTQHLLRGGIHGLVVLGSSGELQSVNDDEKKRVLEIVVDEVKSSVPIIMGGGDTNVKRATQSINWANQLGADAVLAVPPYYFNLNQEGVINYFKDLAQTGVPILLYNIPGFTKVKIEPPTVKSLSQVDGIVGIKDSSRDFEYIQKIIFTCRENSTFRIFLGTDGLLLAGLTLGIEGVMSITPNIIPSWDLELLNAFKAGELKKAREIQEKIGKLLEVLRIGNFPAGLKAAVASLGICSPKMWRPATELTKSGRDQIESGLRELGIV